MWLLTKLEELRGKTIANVVSLCPLTVGNSVVFTFTDETYAVLNAECEMDGGSIIEQNVQLAEEVDIQIRLYAGIITFEEYQTLRKDEIEVARDIREEKELKLLAELKVKYPNA